MVKIGFAMDSVPGGQEAREAMDMARMEKAGKFQNLGAHDAL